MGGCAEGPKSRTLSRLVTTIRAAAGGGYGGGWRWLAAAVGTQLGLIWNALPLRRITGTQNPASLLVLLVPTLLTYELHANQLVCASTSIYPP